MSVTTAEYDVFFSYSREDESFVRRLADQLESVGIKIWLDVKSIAAGVKWSTAIQQGLDASHLLILIITPTSMSSHNVEDEWQYFLDQGKCVLPILWKPAKVQFQLSRIQYIDFHAHDFDTAFQQLLKQLSDMQIAVPAGAVSPHQDIPATQQPLPTLMPPFGKQLNRVIVALLLALLIGFLLSWQASNIAYPLFPQFADSNERLLFFDNMTLLPVGRGEGSITELSMFSPGYEIKMLLLVLALTSFALGMFVTAYLLTMDKSRLRRIGNRYGMLAGYLLSRSAYYALVAVGVAIALLVGTAVWIAYPSDGLFTRTFLEMAITLSLAGIAGMITGLLVSAATNRISGATYSLIGILVVLTLLSGTVVKTRDGLATLSKLTPTRWVQEALGASVNITESNLNGAVIFQQLPVNPRNGQILQGAPPARIALPYQIALDFEYPTTRDELLTRWALLVLYSAIIWAVMSGVLFRYIHTRRRPEITASRAEFVA